MFAAVSDPVAAGLTGDDCGFITGVSNNIPAGEIVNLISDFQPDYARIGFLYTSSETNSVSTINAAKAYCEQNGIAYEEVSIANLSELQTAVETLISRGVDALYTGNDNSIASAMSTYIDVAYEYGVPVYCGADSMVADGGFATIGVDYVQLGRQPLIARYQLDLPLVGLKFSPNYGQSYYEIFELGHYDHNICLTHPFNAFSSRHLITLDIPFRHTTLRVGYLCDIRQSHVNELKYHSYSHAFLLGVVRHLTIQKPRRRTPSGFVL